MFGKWLVKIRDDIMLERIKNWARKKHLSYLLDDRLSKKRKLKLLEWAFREHDLWGPFPIYAKIELDQRCNLKCPKCYRDEVVNNKFLTMDQFKEILDKLGNGLCEVWSHGFGEPTIHPRFLDMMEEVRKRGILWGLATNGASDFWTSDSNIYRMFELNPTKIRFSIDAATPQIFERERFPAKFSEVMDNISRTIEIRNELYSDEEDRNRPRVDLYCVLTMDTLNEIKPMIELKNRLGCDWLTFSDLAWNNDYGTSIEDNAVRQVLNKKEILDLIEPYKNVSKVKFNIPRPDKRRCDYTKQHVYSDAEGNIWTCTCIPGKEPSFGNIFDIDDIKELYQSDKWNKFREQSKTGMIPSRECLRCLQWGPSV